MKETLKRWAKDATLIPPAKRPVGLERNPVTTSITTSTLAVPTKAIRRISRNCCRGRYLSKEVSA